MRGEEWGGSGGKGEAGSLCVPVCMPVASCVCAQHNH